MKKNQDLTNLKIFRMFIVVVIKSVLVIIMVSSQKVQGLQSFCPICGYIYLEEAVEIENTRMLTNRTSDGNDWNKFDITFFTLIVLD